MIFVVIKKYDVDCEKIAGYFTNPEEAYRYADINYNDDYFTYVQQVDCLDGMQNLRHTKYLYSFPFVFTKKSGDWENHLYKQDISAFGLPTEATSFLSVPYTGSPDIIVHARIDEYDIEKAQEKAQKLFYQYLKECNGIPDEKSLDEFNERLEKNQ